MPQPPLNKKAAPIRELNDRLRRHGIGGQVVVDGQKFIWKIDYYDREYKHASEEPENAKITRRVLSIMFASDY